MNEPTMQRVGMGARELKQKAKAYLESRDANKAAEQITALQAQLNDRDTRIETLETRLAALEAGSKKRA
jgi:predicted RNase H-like nuclease (RuvC/YqgF family)